jgi:hypothetical protein
MSGVSREGVPEVLRALMKAISGEHAKEETAPAEAWHP